MRLRAILGVALAGLVLLAARPARADAPAERPAVLLRVEALEGLIGDLRYLVKAVGREEEARQVESLLKSRTGPKGLEGIDVKKPIGLYANVKTSLNESEVVLLLPIADEKTFLDFLGALNLEPKKDKDDLYTLKIENVPVPVLFRFANGYLYATPRLNSKMTLPGKDKLPRPEKVLAAGGGALSLTVNVDQVPAPVRKQAVVAAAVVLGQAKERGLPGATEKQSAVYEAVLDQFSRQLKALMEDATAAQLQVAVDRKANELALGFSLAARPGSTLAKGLAGLSPAKSVGAGVLGKESVMAGLLHLDLPEAVKKAAAPAIDEAIAKALDRTGAQERALVAPLAEALAPTAKSGTLDVALDMRGPGKGGKYTVVASVQVEKGAAIDKAVRELLAKLPEEARESVKEVGKVGDVRFYMVKQKEVDPQAKELFGTGPLFFAFRDDALIVTLGEAAEGLAMFEAVTAKPKAGQPLRLQLSASRLAVLMAKETKAAPEAAKKAFRKPDTDKMRLTVQAGDRLEVKLTIQTAVLAFASYLEQARRE
jgi:hypothetical protein